MPPVTAERSPPDSRMTGADSPVIADSSTLAMPSITSPSAGMISPAATTTLVADRERCARGRPRPSRRAGGDGRSSPSACLRSVSAWALPRPSAIASAKFAKRTVNQSQTAIEAGEDASGSRDSESTVTRTLPTSTTNMTGFRAIRRGSSFAESCRARPRGGSPARGVEEETRRVSLRRGAPRSVRGRGRGST